MLSHQYNNHTAARSNALFHILFLQHFARKPSEKRNSKNHEIPQLVMNF